MRQPSRSEVVAAANAALARSRTSRDERTAAKSSASGEPGLRFHLPQPAGTKTLERISTGEQNIIYYISNMEMKPGTRARPRSVFLCGVQLSCSEE